MSNHRMLETVALELRRQGLPSADITRLLQELDDHVADLFTEQGGRMDESMQVQERIESRLGRPEMLVAAALANRRETSIFGRHPILSFVLAPIPVAILSYFGFFLLCFSSLDVMGVIFGEEYAIEGRAARDYPAVIVYAIRALEIAVRFLPPAATAAFLCWCASRAGMSWRWTMAASCLVALVAGALIVQVTLPAEPGQGQIVLGLGLPPLHKWINLIQFLVPIGVGAAFLRGARNQAVSKSPI